MRRHPSLVSTRHKAPKLYSQFKNSKRYKLADLIAVRAAYEANYAGLVSKVGTPDHAAHVKEERRLSWMEKTIMRELGLSKEMV